MSAGKKFLLLSIALFGLLVPNGFFIYFVAAKFSSFSELLSNHLALAFMIDAFMATGLLCWWFAVNPPGQYTWKMFLALSLIGGLGFSLPFFYFLNKK